MDYDKMYGIEPDVPKPAPVLPPLPDSTDIRDRAKAVEADIFATYYRLMMADSTPPAIKKSCADALADRARGKPAQSVDLTAKVMHETLVINRTQRLTGAVIDVIPHGG